MVLLLLDTSNLEWSQRDIAGISSQISRDQAGLALDSVSLLKTVFIYLLIQII